MFGTIRRHKTWLWLIIIAATIVSFVYFFTPNTDQRGGGRTARDEYISPQNGKPVLLNGRPIKRRQFIDAYQETRLRHFMNTGGREWPGEEENTLTGLERDAIIRLFLLQKLDEMNIQVSNAAVERMAAERLSGFANDLPRFEREILAPHRVTLEDFERFLRNEVRITQLGMVAGLYGKLLLPGEVEGLYRRDNEERATELALFSISNYVSAVHPTPLELTNFYTSQMARYNIGERRRVAYVEFHETNFLAEADKQMAKRTNFNEIVNSVYNRQGTNFFTDTNGVPLSEVKAKEKIREEFRLDFAKVEAQRRASDFGIELEKEMDRRHSSLRTPDLERMAAAKGYKTSVTSPFDSAHDGPEELNVSSDFVRRAFLLSTNEPVSISPLAAKDAVYVIALQEIVPRRVQTYEEVRDKVLEDFKENKAFELANEAGRRFQSTVTNALATKKPFAKICEEAAVHHVALPPFSATTPSLPGLEKGLDLRRLQSFTFDLPVGGVSQFFPTREGGFFLYVRAVLPLDEVKSRTEMPTYTAKIQAARQNDAFNAWFRKQAEGGRLSIPQKESPALGAPRPGRPG
jgi:hypothetical protein